MRSHQYHKERVESCQKTWREIKELEDKSILTETECTQLSTLKHTFALTLSCDYQMGKLIPFGVFSAQPGTTYYLQKLSHDIFGLVNHPTNEASVYMFNECIGPKNTLSYITNYITKSRKLPS